MNRVRFVDRDGSIRTGDWSSETIDLDGTLISPDEVTFLPPVEPTKILGVGYNYRTVSEDHTRFDEPVIWMKGGPHVLSSHGENVVLDKELSPIFEAELGVVIGKPCRGVKTENAMEYVGGFTCANDITNRAATDDQTWLRLKSFDNALPLGPVLAPPERVPENPRIQLWQNGELRQDSIEEAFAFSVPEIVSEFSKYLTLIPEDVIIMGTPAGNDALHDGDSISIEIEGVGRLEHSVSME